MNYEALKVEEWLKWEKKLYKTPGMFENTSRHVSERMNKILPEKVHQTITTAVKSIIHTALFGAKFLPSRPVQKHISLWERDQLAEDLTNNYTKIASAEGAGTGLGGFKLSLVDFPALLAIKMKYLFELAHIYGCSTALTAERLYILYVFQLTFSGYEHRIETYEKMKNFTNSLTNISSLQPEDIDWRKLQQEYRDSIDFRKMLQVVPGIGAIVGAWANYSLMQDLSESAIRCYHKRVLQL